MTYLMCLEENVWIHFTRSLRTQLIVKIVFPLLISVELTGLGELGHLGEADVSNSSVNLLCWQPAKVLRPWGHVITEAVMERQRDNLKGVVVKEVQAMSCSNVFDFTKIPLKQ